jgi:hypothetical protein
MWFECEGVSMSSTEISYENVKNIKITAPSPPGITMERCRIAITIQDSNRGRLVGRNGRQTLR